jgi:predicted oxidoreductase
MLEKIYLSDSGPKLSPVVYGFWRWEEGEDYSPAVMEKIVNLCLDLGINAFDNADVYGGYQCEEMFGKLIQKKAIKREQIVLFTKAGVLIPHTYRPEVKVRYVDSSAEHIENNVHNSLRKLHTDYIDIFLLDHLDPLSNLEETAVALNRLRSAGKIKNIGIANFTVFQHQLLQSYLDFPIVTNHIELNLLNTSALDNGQLDFLKQRYTRPIAASPLAGGRIEHGIDPMAFHVRENLKELSQKYTKHIESVAVAWLIKLGALPLIGTISEQRIRNIADAFTIDMDRQDWYMLYNATKNGNKKD